MRILPLLAALALLSACKDPAQEAREADARQADQIVSQQTGQQYEGKGPREKAAEVLGEDYVPNSAATVAASNNTPVETTPPSQR